MSFQTLKTNVFICFLLFLAAICQRLTDRSSLCNRPIENRAPKQTEMSTNHRAPNDGAYGNGAHHPQRALKVLHAWCQTTGATWFKTYRRTCFPRHVGDPVHSADSARFNSAFCLTLRPLKTLKSLKSLKIVRVLLSYRPSMNERGTRDVIGPAKGHFLVPSPGFLCRIVRK